jgi:hypothetical protein
MAPSCHFSLLKIFWRCIVLVTLGYIFIISLYTSKQFSKLSIVPEIIDRPAVQASELDGEPWQPIESIYSIIIDGEEGSELDGKPSLQPQESIVAEIIDPPVGVASELDWQPSNPLESIVSETIDRPAEEASEQLDGQPLHPQESIVSETIDPPVGEVSELDGQQSSQPQESIVQVNFTKSISSRALL